MSFPKFPRIPRFNREVVLTEKIDGSNGLVYVSTADDFHYDQEAMKGYFTTTPGGLLMMAGSRKRWLNPDDDNFGFAQWVWDHADQLASLGTGHHYGEWYGKGINRNYGLSERRFALFNVAKWGDPDVRPGCCEVVTVLGSCEAMGLGGVLTFWLDALGSHGSVHVPGFKKPEGIVLYHTAGNNLYKVTLEGDNAKTEDGYVVKAAGAQADIGLDPKQVAQQAIHNWTNKDWQLPGLRQFHTELAGAAA